MRILISVTLSGCILATAPLLAQNPTGVIKGRVTLEQAPMPGVTVVASSPALQGGSMTTQTNPHGDYVIRFLPPGNYEVVFARDTFQTLRYPVKVSVAQTRTVDAVMYAKAVIEEIEVTSAYETISSGSQSAVTYGKELMEVLPVSRTLTSAVSLAPGVHGTGPGNAITISGAQSYENLFMVNGVVVNENVRGQAFNLFIEDAIEETTTSISGISAEYGRFSGGVVNTITRSGGNQMNGSYRLSLGNDKWGAATPLTTARIDQLNRVHEATLGGYLLQDHIWYFLAGRDRKLAESHQLAIGSPYTYRNSESRWEAKLTYSPNLNHRIVASFTDIDTQQYNRTPGIAIDWFVIDEWRSLPQSLQSLHYTGVLSDRLFIESQYSARDMSFVHAGGENKDQPVYGTPLLVADVGIAGAPYFCGSACGNEHRDNENYLLKSSIFLATSSFGTHDIVLGYDSFNDIRLSNNHQSASNYVISTYESANYGADGRYYPIIGGQNEEIDFWPVLLTSSGTDYTTNSLFVNDTWRLNNRLTISLGARYDDNDGQDGSGRTVADDSRLSPRLGLAWDVRGDGEWIVHATAGRYVTAIAGAIASRHGAGSPSWFGYGYRGPALNLDANGIPTHEHTTHEVIELMLAWLAEQGGLGNTDLWYYNPAIRGVNTVVNDLKSPYTDELTIGLTKALGNDGVLRADYVHRDYGAFYVTRRDLDTGSVAWSGELTPGIEISELLDLGITINEDEILRRDYDGLHTQLQYRLGDSLAIGGNWTWSHSRGNFDGETASSGPVTSDVLEFPEYQQEEWSYPTGDLAIDQRHKISAWLVWDILSTARHNLRLSWLESYMTGTPYGARARIYIADDRESFVDNPGYVSPPVTVTYSFFGRDAFRTDSIHHTDIAVNYSFFWELFDTRLEVFIQPEIVNLFNEEGVVRPNNTVHAKLMSFNPYLERPVEGIDFTRYESFGQATREIDYQTPRTFRVSLGVRF
jgi:outer membrane receptor protein involved in Fe transport